MACYKMELKSRCLKVLGLAAIEFRWASAVRIIYRNRTRLEAIHFLI
jgi:hypothetical protein